LLAWPARPGDKPAFYRVLKLALLEWSNGAFDGGIAESWTELRARVAEATDVARELSASCGRMLAVSSSGSTR